MTDQPEPNNTAETIIPCDCGSDQANWRGDKHGRRMYICPDCASHYPDCPTLTMEMTEMTEIQKFPKKIQGRSSLGKVGEKTDFGSFGSSSK